MDMVLNNLVRIINRDAPTRAQTRKEFYLSKKQWISKGILKSIQTKNAMFKTCYKKNDALLIEKYKKYTNRLTAVKRIAKQNYNTSLIEITKKDLSKQWRLMNEILQRGGKTKQLINKLITEKNEILTRHEDISNELNNF